jgi:hypothetical protein
MKISALFFAAGIVGCWSGLGVAQTTTALNAEATKMNTLASSQGDSKWWIRSALISTPFSELIPKQLSPA